MLSRVAENLYWISRYIERVENVARLLDVGFHLELDAAGGVDLGPIDSVLTILACRDAFEHSHGRPVAGGDRDSTAVLRFLTYDRSNAHSIVAMLARARENARASQETLSGELWSELNTFYLNLNGPRAHRRFRRSPTRFFLGIKRYCILLDGLIDGTLPRTDAYHFLRLGKNLERINQISRILNIKMTGLVDGVHTLADPPLRAVHWASLLRSCSAYEAYLRDHHERVDPEGVVRYLVLDPDFPRAMRFCVARCVESLREIAGRNDPDGYSNEAERQLGKLDSELRYLDVQEIFGRGLSPFLLGIQDACNRIGDDIHQAYFHT